MTSKQKILQVLKDIKHKSEINPNPEWVEFKINTSVVIGGECVNSKSRRENFNEIRKRWF